MNQLALERSATRKFTLRLIPFLFLCFIIAILDRVNIGFAALRMNEDLAFSNAVFGFGAGIFFLDAIALINSIGNFGRFFGPYVVGYIKDATGSFTTSMIFMGISMIIGSFIILFLVKQSGKALSQDVEKN